MNTLEMLFELYWFFGVGLWGFALVCISAWLLIKRRAMLDSPIVRKPMTFVSLAVGLGLAILFVLGVAVIYLPGAEMREGFIFYFMVSVLLPFVFMAGTGVGLACSVAGFRERLDVKSRSRNLSFAGALIIIGTLLALLALSHPDIRFLLCG